VCVCVCVCVLIGSRNSLSVLSGIWDQLPGHPGLISGTSGRSLFPLSQCFLTAGPRPGNGPWHQLYRAARGSPGSCHFSFLSIFHE
jgi:hypothetical protein